MKKNSEIPRMLNSFIGILTNGSARLTKSSIYSTLMEHKNFPSLFSISEALRRFGFDVVSLKIEPERYKELTCPFIAHIELGEKAEFVLIKSMDSRVKYFNGIKNRILNVEDFLSVWRGVVLFAEQTKPIVEKNYELKRAKELVSSIKIPFIFTSALLFLYFSFLHTTVSTSVLLGLSFNIVGLGLSLLLTLMSADASNSRIKQFCSVSSKIDCNSVLNSSGSKAFGIFPLSEVGTLYFAGFIFAYVLSAQSGAVELTLGNLALISLFASIFPFYSVLYQWRIAKKWCTLCLGVQAVLLLNIGVLYTSITSYNFYLEGWKYIISGFSLAVILWLPIRAFIFKSILADQYEMDLVRFSRNRNHFNKFYVEQPELPSVPANLQTFKLGNPEAKHSILMVTNPFCDYCIDGHKRLTTFLKDNPSFKCEIVVSTARASSDRNTIAAAHWMAADEYYPNVNPIEEWFDDKNRSLEKFNKRFPVEIEQRHLDRAISHGNWVREANVRGTPFFFYNNRPIPEPYKLEDLGHLQD